jgi:hypothetical protein
MNSSMYTRTTLSVTTGSTCTLGYLRLSFRARALVGTETDSSIPAKGRHVSRHHAMGSLNNVSHEMGTASSFPECVTNRTWDFTSTPTHTHTHTHPLQAILPSRKLLDFKTGHGHTTSRQSGLQDFSAGLL